MDNCDDRTWACVEWSNKYQQSVGFWPGIYCWFYITKNTCAKLFLQLGSTVSTDHRPSFLTIWKLPHPSIPWTLWRFHTNCMILNMRCKRASMPLDRTRLSLRRLHKPTILRGKSQSHQGPLPICHWRGLSWHRMCVDTDEVVVMTMECYCDKCVMSLTSQACLCKLQT